VNRHVNGKIVLVALLRVDVLVSAQYTPDNLSLL